jgi:hypothetical protein
MQWLCQVGTVAGLLGARDSEDGFFALIRSGLLVRGAFRQMDLWCRGGRLREQARSHRGSLSFTKSLWE